MDRTAASAEVTPTPVEGAKAPVETVQVLWARMKGDHYPVQFVAAFNRGVVEAWPEVYDAQRAEHEQFFRDLGGEAEFFTTWERIPLAGGPPGGEE